MPFTRNAGYLPLPSASTFLWHYSPVERASTDLVILCPPIGQAYMSTHRTLRHLAEAIAETGVHCIRIDYPGQGDSADPAEGLTADSCILSLVQLCDYLRAQRAFTNISLVGFGLGASFAYKAASKTDVTALVLWDPCISGRRYLREVKLLSEILPQQEKAEISEIEVSGLQVHSAFSSSLERLSLVDDSKGNAESVLYLYQQEKTKHTLFAKQLSENVKRISISEYEGYADMVAYPTETVVPYSAINEIVAFVQVSRLQPDHEVESSTDPLELKASHLLGSIEEQAINFGSGGSLFGVLCKSKKADGPQDSVVVFLNCGAEHHVGPHRLYTQFARRIAEKGVPSFRFDIEGIGDSPAVSGNDDNNAYSPVAIRDIVQAIEILEQRGFKRFQLAGICAGAYHAFKAAAELPPTLCIPHAILINPLVYDWDYSNVGGGNRVGLYGDIARYRGALLSREVWKRMFTAKINVLRVFSNLISYTASMAITRIQSLMGIDNIVAKRLDNVVGRPCKLHLLLAENEPGLALLLDDAANSVKRYKRAGSLEVKSIDGADHGLSKKYMQEKLYKYLEDIFMGAK